MHGVEARERRLPCAVDRAVAFVGDHHVEVAGGVFVGAADHGLEQGYRDLLLLARCPGPQPVARVRGKEILDGSERLPGKLVAVHEHEHALRPTGLEETLQVKTDEVGLPGTGRQLHQKPAFAELERMVEGAHRLDLVRAHGARLALPNVVFRNFDGREGAAAGAHLDHALEVTARKEVGDRPRIVVLVVPEVGDLAVCQEDERGSERLRIRERLLLGNVRVDGVPLGFDHGEGTASLVVQDVVGAASRGGRRGKVKNCHELADHPQLAFGIGRKDEVVERGIGIQRLEPNLVMTPISFHRGSLRAFVLLDRKLASERGIDDTALPDEHELSLAGAATLGSKQAVSAIRNDGFHRASADLGDEVLGSQANRFGNRNPTDLVANHAHRAVGSESAGCGYQVEQGSVGLERPGTRTIDHCVSRRRTHRRDFGPDHRLVPQVPTGLPQPVVNRDSRVRFGMTKRHPTILCRECTPRGRCNTVMARL